MNKIHIFIGMLFLGAPLIGLLVYIPALKDAEVRKQLSLFNVECESVYFKYPYIRRCHNEEIICYVISNNGMECKFK